MRKYFVPNMNVDASKIHFKNDKFDENITNVSSALKYLNDKNNETKKTTYQFINLKDVGVEFNRTRTIKESLDILIDTCEPKINQVYRGQCLAKDNPEGIGNAEIEITILKHSNNEDNDTLENRDIVSQVVLSSTSISPYRWYMMFRRQSTNTESNVSVSLQPMLFTNDYINNKIKNVLSFDENGNLIVTIDGISKTFIPKE